MKISANTIWHTHMARGIVLGVACLVTACSGLDGYGQTGSNGPLEHQLMAAIALERGQYPVAAQEYLRLAQKSRDPEAARRATELSFAYGFDAYALASAERWVELAPDDRIAHAYLGRIYVRSNQLQSAFESLDLALGPVADRSDSDYLVLAAELSDGVAPARGLAVFQEFNEAYPENPGIVSGLASLAAQSGDYELAVAAGRQALNLAPEWPVTRVWFARYLMAAGDTQSAFEQMAFAVQANPGVESELEFVELLAAADERQDAMDRLERMVDRYPERPEVIRLRGALAAQWGDLDQAQEDFGYLVSEAYYVNEAFFYLGEISFQREDYLQAIRYFERVGPGGWLKPARNAVSQSYLALGDGDTALAVQREFAAEYPKQAIGTLQAQAEILVQLNRLNEALEGIDIALEYSPWNEGLWLYRGGLQEQLGEPEQAVESFRRALQLAPSNPEILNALGYTMTTAGQDYDEAYEYIALALELDPENPAIMDSMGWILYKQGDPQGAREWLEKAYERLPDPEIAAHLGELMWQAGEQDEAIDLWSEALQQYPDSRPLNETTERFLR